MGLAYDDLVTCADRYRRKNIYYQGAALAERGDLPRDGLVKYGRNRRNVSNSPHVVADLVGNRRRDLHTRGVGLHYKIHEFLAGQVWLS